MRPKRTALVILGCAVALLAACGPAAGNGTAASSSTAAQDTTPTEASTATSTTSAAAVAPPATSSSVAAGVDFTMPNEVGQVLQDAQNAMHTFNVFYSKSHDLLGVRHQILDRDWKVCTQNVPAGQHVTGTAEGVIDFGVVKLSETCP
jgi:hypothetical protein